MSEEEVIGRSGDPNDSILVTSTNIITTYCPHCKKGQHCIHGTVQRKGEKFIPINLRPTIMLKDKCSNDSCECSCRRSYTDRNGKRRPLGTIDTSDPLEGFSKELPRDATDDLIDRLNASNKLVVFGNSQ